MNWWYTLQARRRGLPEGNIAGLARQATLGRAQWSPFEISIFLICSATSSGSGASAQQGGERWISLSSGVTVARTIIRGAGVGLLFDDSLRERHAVLAV